MTFSVPPPKLLLYHFLLTLSLFSPLIDCPETHGMMWGLGSNLKSSLVGEPEILSTGQAIWSLLVYHIVQLNTIRFNNYTII